MYKCKICDEKFSTSHAIGGHSKKHNIGPKELEYNKSPRKCGNCGEKLKWSVVRKNRNCMYCNCKCAAFKRNLAYLAELKVNNINE